MPPNLAARMERWILYVALTLGALAGLADLLGVSDSEWLSDRVSGFTLIVLSSLTLHLLLTASRSDELMNDQLRRLDVIKSELQLLGQQSPTLAIMDQIWKSREPVIEALLDRLTMMDAARNSTRDLILSEVAKSMDALREGNLEGRGQRFPWDSTIIAMDLEAGTFAYHPTGPMSGRSVLPRFESGLGWVLTEAKVADSGERIVTTKRTSEQLLGVVGDESWSTDRVSKVYFRKLARSGLVVVFESHISLVHQVPRGRFQEHKHN